MGWKALKEHYRIADHIVQVTEKGVCIGSGHLPELIVITLDGKLLRRYESRGSEELTRYQSEIDADPNKLIELLQSEDAFTISTPVYTFQGAEIVEKFCEKPGYPNVTHDGQLMFKSKYSLDRIEVIRWAKEAAAYAQYGLKRVVDDARRKLAIQEQELSAALAVKTALDLHHPQICVEFELDQACQ
jgi:hypothetical protein